MSNFVHLQGTRWERIARREEGGAPAILSMGRGEREARGDER